MTNGSSDCLLVLLGAGASYDCVDGATATIEATLRPPLVDQLFRVNQPFDRILNRYPGARARADEIRSRLQQGKTLEELLRQMTAVPSLSLRRSMWQVPLYLQELLGEISQHYVQAGSTKFETMIAGIIQSAFRDVMILTVNYDLFVEHALHSLMGKIFNAPRDYGWTCDDQRWTLVKLHGSVNWGRGLIPPRAMNSWVDVIPTLTDLKLDEEIVILSGHDDSRRFHDREFRYPALSLPIAGKTDFVCPAVHVDRARSFASEATHVLVIGFSGLDQHVLEALIRPINRLERLRVVCGSRQAGIDTWNRLTSVNQKFNITGPVFEGGFSQFVGSGELHKFLGVD